MGFCTKKSVVATPSFSERMASIKSMFKTAHENANNLHAEMESEIAKKESQISALQEDIKAIGVTKQNMSAYPANWLDEKIRTSAKEDGEEIYMSLEDFNK